jgi:hypothetical protein
MDDVAVGGLAGTDTTSNCGRKKYQRWKPDVAVGELGAPATYCGREKVSARWKPDVAVGGLGATSTFCRRKKVPALAPNDHPKPYLEHKR